LLRTTLTTALMLLACSGCVMTRYRQQGLEIGLSGAEDAREQIVTAAKAMQRVAEEVGKAAAEERAPSIGAPAGEAARALQAAHDHVEEIGETLAVMQQDVGRSPVPPPATPAEREAWRARYRAASRLLNMAMSWARGAISAAVGRRVGAPAGPAPEGWSPASVAGLIGAITAAVGAAGETARRGVKRSRAKRAGHDAELAEALDALDEVKARHPRAVKEATRADRRAHLRRAFVRREGGA
jgi:hypothetical protein